MTDIAPSVPRRRIEMALTGDTLTIGRRVFIVTPAMRAAALVRQGRAPVAAELIVNGAPPMFASAVSLVGWAAAWEVVDKATFAWAARWRMGRGR